MPRRHPKTCKRCERSAGGGFSISARGLCDECSLTREAENIVAMKDKSGPFYDHWVRRSFLAFRRALVASEQGEA